MKKMAAGSFKVHCLAVMDEVQANRETVVITKHGKPVAKRAIGKTTKFTKRSQQVICYQCTSRCFLGDSSVRTAAG